MANLKGLPLGIMLAEIHRKKIERVQVTSPICPTCGQPYNRPSLDVFVKHPEGSRYCFVCEENFVPKAATEGEPK